jgi:hypothetical protein
MQSLALHIVCPALVLQVVSLNNELCAARAEAMAAEEAVLWELSGRLMGCLDDVETVSATLCNVTVTLSHSGNKQAKKLNWQPAAVLGSWI